MNHFRLQLLGLVAAIAPSTATAQAFTQPKGEGRVIATTIYSHSDLGFDDEARTRDLPDYDRAELYVLAEYGVTDDLTLLLTPSFRNVRIDGEESSAGLGFVELGGRYRLIHSDRWTLSVQGTGRIPGSTRRDLPAQIGATDPEFDLRLQGGTSFPGGFATLEGGYRWRANDPPNEVHVDATVGVHVAPRLSVIINSFNTVSNGKRRGVFSRYRYHNVYASAAYDVAPRITVQAGILGTVAGRNALRERGLFAGAWLRF